MITTKQTKLIIIKRKPNKKLGYSLIAIGIITYPIPLTTPICILLGLKVLGIKKSTIYRYLRAMGIRQRASWGLSKTHLYKDIREVLQ